MTSQQQKPSTGGLERSLNHGQMTMIALGLAVGTGLFLGSGGAIKIAGPAVIISYAIGSLIAAIIGACAGEMAVAYPVRGGFGTLAGKFLGPYAGYMTRWAYWATTVTLTGAELVAVGAYMLYWYPQIPLVIWVVLFGAIIVFLNLTSVKSFGNLEFFLSSIKVSAVVIFIVFGLVLVFFGLPSHVPTGTVNLVNNGGFIPNGPISIWTSLAIVMFSFGGIELISISAAEASDPVRSVRSSARAMMWRLAFFYVLALFVILCLIPWQEAAELNGEIETSPFVMVFSQLGIPFIAGITNLVVLIAALSGANAALYAATRQLHALGHDSMAPSIFAKTNSKGIPALALGVSTLGAVVAVVMAVSKVGGIFTLMMALVTLCVLVVWFMILLSYLRFKAIAGDVSAFRVWGGSVTATLGMVGDMTSSIMVGIGFFAIITVIYYLVVKKNLSIDEAAFDEASAHTAAQPIIKK